MKISVCITHYNRPEGLEQSLESLTKQTRIPDEIIVSDDASQENPEEIVEKFTRRLRRLRLIRNQQNLGMPGNLSSAIRHAGGEYIINLHDGDTYSPCLIQKWEACLDQDSRVGLAFSGYDSRSSGGRLWQYSNIARISSGNEFFEKHMLPVPFSKIWGTVIARRSAYDQTGGFDPQYGPWADVDMWIRISHRFDIGYTPDAIICLSDKLPHFRSFSWKPSVYLLCMKENRLIKTHCGAALLNRLTAARKVFRKSVRRQIFGCARRLHFRSALRGLSLLNGCFRGCDGRALKEAVDRHA